MPLAKVDEALADARRLGTYHHADEDVEVSVFVPEHANVQFGANGSVFIDAVIEIQRRERT